MPQYQWKSRTLVGQDYKPLIIRAHVPMTERAKRALEEWVDQLTWRREEWSRHGGDQALAENLVSGHQLTGEDLATFIAELKARKTGLDYTALQTTFLRKD